MSKFKPAMKCTGSKRSQAEDIIKYFPNEIKTYWEPFIGGASMTMELIFSGIKVEKIICSDLNKDFIELWKKIKDNPEELVEEYSKMWFELNLDDDTERRKKYYNYIRERFNQYRNSTDFLFLNRTCLNGLVRYNKKGEFNASFHFTRKGIKPENLSKDLLFWSERLKKNKVEFICQDYSCIDPKLGDFVYLDPPYAGSKGIYQGNLDYEKFWDWVRKLPCEYVLSFTGKTKEGELEDIVPKDIYAKHVLINSGVSSFRRIKIQVIEEMLESLYISRTTNKRMEM